jgi:hypothetical protein
MTVRRPRRRGVKKKTTARIIGDALSDLVALWRETLKRPRRRAVFVALALAFVVAMLLARTGTVRSRVAAGGLLVISCGVATYVFLRQRRRWDDPRVAIERLASRADPERAARALRALSLLDDDGVPKDRSTSGVLAQLHVARQLAALPRDRIVDEAKRAARRTNGAAIVVAVIGLGLGGTHAFSVIEGADVLVSRGGTAPVGLPYVQDLTLMARPPEYLHDEEHKKPIYGHLSLPRGTLLTFRGEPLHAGRRLVLTDGKSEVPFVDDGSDKVVARWPVQDSVELRIVARFGSVVIPEPDATDVTSIADAAPIVKLEGAPKTIALTSPQGKDDIPIRYEATDDHGLREIHLVMKSAGRPEERRVLAHLDGETRSDRGGSVLHPSDKYIKQSHAAVLVRVEAKDNDPITGPKWGVSESFMLLPPDIGEAEATRLDALRALRDAYVDVLAWRMENVPGKTKTFLDDEKRGADDVASSLDRTLLTSYGVVLPSRLVALVRAQQKRVADSVAAERRGATATTHAKVVKTTETMVLVIDGIVRGLARKDARTASKQLADVAEDLAGGIGDQRVGRELTQAKARADGAVQVLEGGERQLAHLGMLGRDLSGAIHAGLLRVARATAGGDLAHAELAARDLKERLAKADPSFGSRGGSGGHAHGESGSGAQSGGGSGDEPSEAERAFNEAAQDLEQLTQDHAGAMGKVDQALSHAVDEDELKQLRDDAKPHAANVREAVKDLPSVGGGSDTWTSKGAAARELGEQMARSLESGSLDDAVQSGTQALHAIDEAKGIAARERYRMWDDRTADGANKKLDDAKKHLEPEIKWAEDQLAQLKKRAAQHAGAELGKSGTEEQQLAERARKLAEHSRERGSLPEAALEALDGAERASREAAQALQRGDADNGATKQKEAQHKLDAAKQALGDDAEDEGELSEDGEGRSRSGGQADIPKADAHKGPEEFRKRVLHGLSEPASSKHKDAITRYAEGLLR